MKRERALPGVLAASALALSAGVRAAEGEATEAEALPTPAAAQPASAQPLSVTLRAYATSRQANTQSAFYPAQALTGAGQDEQRAELELRGKAGPVRGVVTARASHAEGSVTGSRLIVNELVAESALPGAGAYFSVGKKILSWDVGYAFRPLDVLQHEDRRTVVPPTLEGIPQLGLEWFGAESSLSLIVANPGRGRETEVRDDGSTALRAFTRVGSADVYGLLRWSDRNGWEAGSAFSWVANESWELHGSALAQQRFDGWRYINATGPSSTAPWQASPVADGRKLLVGATWTNEKQTSVIVEAWHDGTGLTPAQWQQALAHARAVAALPLPAAASSGLVAWDAGAFSAPSGGRNVLFTRISQKLGDLELAADRLTTLADRGHVTTLTGTWTSNRWRFDGGMRRFGGPADSGWGNAPTRNQLFAQGQWFF